MQYFTRKYEDVIFIVLSQDQRWCKENLSSSKNVYVLPVGSAGEDLATLSFCHHVIMSVGSYGRWAGWLAAGEVIFYTKDPAARKEGYLPYWIGMNGTSVI